MSAHGWSSEEHGDGTGERARGWAPPFETETPDPGEIRGEEEEARAEDIARGDAKERVPARDGQSGDVERGTLRQTDQRAGGYETQTDQGEEEDMFGIAPPSPRTMRRAESVLETPRGRQLFNEFLEQLVRQPAPSEQPTHLERRSTRRWRVRRRRSQDLAKEWRSLWIRLVLRYNLCETLEVTFQWSRLRT
ncbi:hypothetical protein PI126_g20332 [Phytophthora idaei]|nr:hypothetical protein PI126_g20332 [Phytophthora idaei]